MPKNKNVNKEIGNISSATEKVNGIGIRKQVMISNSITLYFCMDSLVILRCATVRRPSVKPVFSETLEWIQAIFFLCFFFFLFLFFLLFFSFSVTWDHMEGHFSNDISSEKVHIHVGGRGLGATEHARGRLAVIL